MKLFAFKDVVGFVLIGAIAVLAFSLGSYNLRGQSIWLDEAVTVQVSSQETYGDVVKSVMETRPYPPLYFLIVHDFLKVWDNEFGLRLPSVIFGVLTLIMVFLLGRTLFGNSVGIVASILFLLAPTFLFHLRDGNCYTMLACLTTVSTLSLWKAWETRRATYWVGYGIFSLLALSTHLFAVPFILGQWLAYLFLSEAWKVFRGPGIGARIQEYIKRERVFVTVAGVVILAMLIIIPQIQSEQTIDKFRSGVAVEGSALERLFSANTVKWIYKNYAAYFPFPVFWILQILGVIYGFMTDAKKTAFLLIVLLAPFLAQMVFLMTVFSSAAIRYSITLAPMLYLLTACGLRSGELLIGRIRWGKVFAAGVLAAMLFSMWQPLSLYIRFVKPQLHRAGIYDWRGVSEILKKHADPEKDIVFVCADYVMIALDYYYDGPVKRVGIKQMVDDPAYLNEVVDRNLFGKQRVWLILSHEEVDEPIVRYLEGFSRTFSIPAGPLTITTQRTGEQRLSGISITMYTLQAES
ncbi:MAG: glycosyltransferase family 39 protein [Candidatus Omnitrophota bacterium]|nr:glycosyltransferase family 39 protein [Candidatus Omnitrophota bacterium]